MLVFHKPLCQMVSFDLLSDALVLLIDNENIVDTLAFNYSKNRYESSLVVQQGIKFLICAFHIQCIIH